jgi:DNA-binding MarR family transcriptional regulator
LITSSKDEKSERFSPVSSRRRTTNAWANITTALEERYADGVRTVVFFDEVINGSDGTLRQILHLQRDIEDWEPVLVFNGTAHMLDQVHAKIEPLWDCIDDEITLAGLDPEGALDLVNKRLRYYCAASEWRGGEGCAHDEGSVEPFTRESVKLIHQDVTPYPRHIRRQCNEIIEAAARQERETIDFEFVREALAEEVSRKLDGLSDVAFDTVELLEREGELTANAITEALEVSPYHVNEALTTLEKEGLIRATDGTRGMEYKLTEQARRELSNVRQS